MAMQTYEVQLAFYFGALSQNKIQVGELLDYDTQTRKVCYNGIEAVIPQMATALREGWILLESEARHKKVVAPPVNPVHSSTRYEVTPEKKTAGSARRISKISAVEPQDEQPVRQVKLFTSANAGAIDLSGSGDYKRDIAIAEAKRVKLAAQNSPLPKVKFTEGVSVTTTTGNRANTPGNGQVWDGGTQSEMVGRVSDREGKFRRAAQAPVQEPEEYDEVYADEYDGEYDGEENYDDLPTAEDDYTQEEILLDGNDLKARMDIILNALPKAHQTDIRLHIAILQAIIPGFPAWDPRAHWKKKVKAYQDEIEVNPNYVTALRLVETDAFWKHIDK